MIRCVLFDIDGTLLLGTDQGHRQAYVETLRAIYGLEADPYEWSGNRGHTDSAILVNTLRHYRIEEQTIQERLPLALNYKAHHFSEHLFDYLPWPRVAPGAVCLLEKLRSTGVLVGVITGNEKRVAALKLRKVGLESYFSPLWGAFGEESTEREKLSLLLWPRLQALMPDIAPSEVLMVGDTPLDVAAARKIGCHSWAVSSGRYSSETLTAHHPCLLDHDLEVSDWTKVSAHATSCALQLTIPVPRPAFA